MYDSFVSFWKDHTTVNIQKETVFSKDALYSGGMAIGSGFMNASVDWSPNSTEDEPVMLIIGIDVDGKPFEAEVAIKKVNPRNASVIELFALDGYARANGLAGGATRAAAASRALTIAGESPFLSRDEIQKIKDSANSFTTYNFLDSIKDLMGTLLFHGNTNSYIQYRDTFEYLSNFPR